MDRPAPGRLDYLPFGAGPDVCIGAQLAMSEAVLVLTRLIRASRLACCDDDPVLPVGLLATRPDRAPRFTLTPR